jgi:hypothetical protein
MNLIRDVSMAMSANSNSTSDWIRDHKCLYVDLSTIPVHSACTDRMLYDIQAIAFYVIILSFIAIPIKSIFLYKRLRTPMKSQVSHRIQCFFGLFALAYDVGYFIHGMLKLFGPSEYVIGRANGSVGIDIVFFLTSSANVCLLHCVALHLSQFLLGTLRIVPAQFRDKIVRIIRRVDTTAVLAPVFGVVLSALPFLCYAAPSYSALFNALYLLGYWMVMVYQSLLNFFLALYTEREMRRVLDNNIDSHLERADNSVDNSVSSIPSAYSSNHDAKLQAAITDNTTPACPQPGMFSKGTLLTPNYERYVLCCEWPRFIYINTSIPGFRPTSTQTMEISDIGVLRHGTGETDTQAFDIATTDLSSILETMRLFLKADVHVPADKIYLLRVRDGGKVTPINEAVYRGLQCTVRHGATAQLVIGWGFDLDVWDATGEDAKNITDATKIQFNVVNVINPNTYRVVMERYAEAEGFKVYFHRQPAQSKKSLIKFKSSPPKTYDEILANPALVTAHGYVCIRISGSRAYNKLLFLGDVHPNVNVQGFSVAPSVAVPQHRIRLDKETDFDDCFNQCKDTLARISIVNMHVDWITYYLSCVLSITPPRKIYNEAYRRLIINPFVLALASCVVDSGLPANSRVASLLMRSGSSYSQPLDAAADIDPTSDLLYFTNLVASASPVYFNFNVEANIIEPWDSSLVGARLGTGPMDFMFGVEPKSRKRDRSDTLLAKAVGDYQPEYVESDEESENNDRFVSKRVKAGEPVDSLCRPGAFSSTTDDSSEASDIDNIFGLIVEAKQSIEAIDGPLGQLAAQMIDTLNIHRGLLGEGATDATGRHL